MHVDNINDSMYNMLQTSVPFPQRRFTMISTGRYGYHLADIAELKAKSTLDPMEAFNLTRMEAEVTEYEAGKARQQIPIASAIALVINMMSPQTDRREDYVMPSYAVIEDGRHEIMPYAIPDTFEHLWDAFDESETECSATWLLRLARSNGDWRPFTFESINALYRTRVKTQFPDFSFNRLIEPGMHYGMPGERWLVGGGWIVVRNGMHYFTDDFVCRAHESALRSAK